MRKTVCKVTAAFGLVAAMMLSCTVTLFEPHSGMTADAKDSVILYDEFGMPEKSDKWLRNDFIEAKDDLAICMSGGSYQNSVTYSKYEIHGDCEISFTASGTRRKDDDWFGLQFGHATPWERGPLAKAMVASFAMRNGKSETRYMHDKGGELAGWDASTVDSSKNASTSVLDDMFQGKTNVAIRLTATGERESDGRTLYTVEISHWRQSADRPAKPQYTYTDVPADGYFGFAAMGPHTFRIYDFAAKEKNDDGEYETVSSVNIAETEEEQLVYNTFDKDAVFYACGSKRTAVWLSADGSEGVLAVKDMPNGIALGKAAILSDSRSKKQFELSFDVSVSDFPAKSSFGVGLGLTEKATSVDDGYYIALVNDGNGNAFARLSYCGRDIARSETFTPAAEGTVKVIGYNGGKVTIEYGSFSHTFTDVRFVGYFAIGTSGEASPTALIDNVCLTVRSVSDNTVSPDVAIDFSGVKTEVDESDPEISWSSPYIDDNKWYCGSAVVMPQRVVTGDKKYISFNLGSDTACFGSYGFYSDFIARFSLTVTQDSSDAPENGMIGLSFGKTMYLSGASESKGVYFCKSNMGMTLRTVNCTFADGKTISMPDDGKNYDLWSSADWHNSPVTYQVMVIARGGNVSLYYAPEGADAAEMTVCRAQIDAGDTYGAVAVSGLNGVSFRLHDYSVTNIAVRR